MEHNEGVSDQPTANAVETIAATGSDSAPPTVAQEIAALLPQSSGQIGLVAALLLEGITDRGEMVERGAAANTGAVANLLTNIRALRDGEIPSAPTMAVGARSAARSFLRQHRTRLSPAAVEHLETVITDLTEVAEDRSAQEAEDEQLHRASEELEAVLEVSGGVYVYTYPHYWRYPTVEGTRRTLLKIGMSSGDATTRIRQQTRQTAVPEDPLILRVYKSSGRDPAAIERDFHRLLNAADHTRESQGWAGREWFETSVQFLDAIAAVLGLTTVDIENSAI